MNLEVDVMEGDGFAYTVGFTYQYRGKEWRRLGMNYKGEWTCGVLPSKDNPIDLPAFTRYCEGCGLTVKEVKPEPAVETIKPPEWACVFKDGGIIWCDNKKAAENRKREWGGEPSIVRIDWGAK